MTEDLADQTAMTLDAVVTENLAIARPDANGFVEILQRESFGVPKSVLGFGQIFSEEIMGRVTVVARCNGMMAGLLPAFILVAHDMAVDAGFRVIAEVRAAFRVIKRIATHPNNNA
jgi:hypothetical protein